MQKSVLHECQDLSTFDQVGREFVMQDRHGRDLAESVMLSPGFQTSWVMENLHDKFTLFQTHSLLHLINHESVRKKAIVALHKIYKLDSNIATSCNDNVRKVQQDTCMANHVVHSGMHDKSCLRSYCKATYMIVVSSWKEETGLVMMNTITNNAVVLMLFRKEQIPAAGSNQNDFSPIARFSATRTRL